jgi:D-alanyl-D-alanine carboxypeptidase
LRPTWIGSSPTSAWSVPHPGVIVRGVDAGETLYGRGAEDRLPPDSNNDLLTSVAALEALGPDRRFTTGVLTTANRQDSVLLGDLYLSGGRPAEGADNELASN